MTSYKVLRAITVPSETDIGDLGSTTMVTLNQEAWLPVDELEANSADHAIRKHVEVSGVAGRYEAVPARSWNPIDVRLEATTTIKFGDG